MSLKAGSKVGIVCCSNGLEEYKKEQLEQLMDTLQSMGITPLCSDYLFAKGKEVRSGTAKERAEALMTFYREDEVEAIFDISGGDVAVEILPYLDFDVIAKSHITFWGYSDLTVIIDAIYAKTGKSSCLYQVRNLVRRCGKKQRQRFQEFLDGGDSLEKISYEFVQGKEMEGIVLGGNARCLLKLSGSPYFPNMQGKILFLEGLSGCVPQLVAFFCQLKIQGVFEQVNGILLGTFTEMERKKLSPTAVEILLEMVPDTLPVAVTKEVGHEADAKCLRIGEYRKFSRNGATS